MADAGPAFETRLNPHSWYLATAGETGNGDAPGITNTGDGRNLNA